MINFRDEIIKIIAGEFDEVEVETLETLIEVPPSPDMGDYAFPTFSFAKVLRKAPNMIAEELAGKLKSEFFEKIEAKGPYLNFFINKELMAKLVIDEILEKESDFGKSDFGKGKNAIVEFSSPNIAKAFHIGHLRSTVIGNAIRNTYDFLGFNTIAINHLGDYGTQFGMLITAYKKWGDEEAVKANPIPELLKLYVQINQEAENDESLNEESREWFRKLENQDPEAVELWTFFREVSLIEFDRVYKMLGIEFDSFAGEASYSDKMEPIINEIDDKNMLVESKNAQIVDLEEYNMPPMLIKKSDGSTLYATRDLAAAQYRWDTYHFYKNIYVVGSQQNLHFKQLFQVLELMGKDWAKDCVHIPFGMVSLPEGTMSTRRGNVIYLEDVLLTAIEKTKEIIKDRDIEDKENLAADIGIGAVVFQELFNDRNKDYVFDWDKLLSFEGETGPYVQYTHARICSLLSKGEFDKNSPVDISLLNGDEEFEILKSIYNFEDVIKDAGEKYQPFFITRHIVSLAQAFNKYYASTSILVDDEELKNARLMLCYATKTVIKNGLGILGIKAPEKM
ncbi:MAG: arginine--tRNA ligase [Tissierellia bacterium]|nr:arginine--tRNA ligase [Tissierellia bacterium]